MRPRRGCLWFAMLFAAADCGLIPHPARASAFDGDPNEPPIAGQPSDFTGAVGSYRIATSATPTELQAEEPIGFTVRITGQGPGERAPRRPDLHRIPAFARRFVIEDIPETANEHGGVWTYRYRLKPRDSEVTEIPALRFVYFKPGVLPKEKAFRTVYASAIPLVVRPRAAVKAMDIQGRGQVAQLPESVRQIRTGAKEVLSRDRPYHWPAPLVFSTLVLLPLILCAGWYITWRRLYPDAGQLLHQRRSRAAQRALAALDKNRSLAGPGAIDAMMSALTAYLGGRLNFASHEPTPIEVAEHARAAGYSDEVTEKLVAVLRSVDAARFGQSQDVALDDLRHRARQLILHLEGLPCLSPS